MEGGSEEGKGGLHESQWRALSRSDACEQVRPDSIERRQGGNAYGQRESSARRCDKSPISGRPRTSVLLRLGAMLGKYFG